MYITVRGTPKGEPNGSVRENETGRSGKARIAPAVIGLGVVSLLTDISSESVAAILPLYITVVVGLGPLAFGFIDGIYQGISAVAGGRWPVGRPVGPAEVGRLCRLCHLRCQQVRAVDCHRLLGDHLGRCN